MTNRLKSIPNGILFLLPRNLSDADRNFWSKTLLTDISQSPEHKKQAPEGACPLYVIIVYSECHLCFEVSYEVVDSYTLLLHCVTVADCNAVVLLKSIEVVGDAERSSNLVLTAVSLTDSTSLVEVNHELLGEHLVYFLSLGSELLNKRKNCTLERCKSRVEVHYCADFLLLVAVLVCGNDLLLIVSLCNDREEESLNAE